jgi:hypothetical protein
MKDLQRMNILLLTLDFNFSTNSFDDRVFKKKIVSHFFIAVLNIEPGGSMYYPR